MDLNTALMESITSMSEYFVAANTRTSFTDLADSANNTSSLGASSINSNNNTSNNMNSSTMNNHLIDARANNHQTFINSSTTMHKHQMTVPTNHLSTNQMQNNHHQPNNQHHHHTDNNANHSHHGHNTNHPENNAPSMHQSSNLCNQHPYHHNSNNNSSSNQQNHSSTSATQTSTRFSQPARTQIPIHCYIEQLDACADMLSYQSSLSDNDLFNTRNPTNQAISSISSNNDTIHQHQQQQNHHPHLHQSKLALESVTNCTSSTNLSDLDHHSNGLFDDNNPTETNELDTVDTNLDQLDTHSPLNIQPNQQAASITSSNMNTPQTSSSICDDSLDTRRPSLFYESASSFHSCKETYVIVTSNILYIDLVRTVLLQLGYTAKDLINAKATIQIKNWKPLALDQVTEDKSATVGEVLGDISTFVTLRIRLYSSVTQVPTEWTETMIRQVVLALTQTMSQLTLSKLCNISQPLISSIVRGGKKLGRRKCAEFGQWYMNYIKSADARPSTMFCEGGGGARLVFDKTREIPKLKAWFANNTKPSDEMLEEYSKILNQDALRKDRPQVTGKALKNWWKNERQKLGIRQREIRGRPKLKRID